MRTDRVICRVYHSNELFLLIDKEMFIGESGELLNGSWESKGNVIIPKLYKNLSLLIKC